MTLNANSRNSNRRKRTSLAKHNKKVLDNALKWGLPYIPQTHPTKGVRQISRKRYLNQITMMQKYGFVR